MLQATHLGRFIVEHLLGGKQCLQVGNQEQYSRIVEGGQLIMQFRIQNFIGATCLLQLFAAFGYLKENSQISLLLYMFLYPPFVLCQP